MITALERISGGFSEKTLDLIDPRRVGRGEVHREPGVLLQPRLDAGMLMSAVIIPDHVGIKVVRDLGVDLSQELLELDRPVAEGVEVITVPSSTLRAASRLVAPCQT